MKKTYQQPALAEMSMEQCSPISASLIINNNAQDGIRGDVKAGEDWDIWGNETEEE